MTATTRRRRERRRPLWPAALLAGLVLVALGLVQLGDRAGSPPAPPRDLPPAALHLERDERPGARPAGHAGPDPAPRAAPGRASHGPAPVEAAPEPRPAEAGTAAVAPRDDAAPRHVRRPAPVTVAPPARISIPRLGVDAPVDPVGLDAARAVVVPPDPTRAGWYVHGPRPGETGPAILDGHVDTVDGPGVFFEIGALRAGDVIRVARRDGTHAGFRVQAVERAPKDRFPTRRVYAPTSVPALRLITCGGAFDEATGHYEDNTIVYAVGVPSP